MNISIVVTAYNVEKYIEECINSIIKQSYDNIELIIVEDKSTDNTAKIVDRLSKDISFIKVIHNTVNIGAGLSRRIGISNTTGDYVMLVDGDDFLEDSLHISKLANAAIETNADVVSGGIKILREDGSYDTTSYGNIITEGYDRITKFWGERIVFMNNKIIRRTLLEKVPYCHRRYIEDTPVIIPLLWYANKVAYIDSIGYVYRMREDSLTHNSNVVKDIIYKGLCWCDLMDFFTKNDKEVFKCINIKNYIANTINLLNNTVLTPDLINPYANDFAEFMMRLHNIIKINNIDFKIPYTDKV